MEKQSVVSICGYEGGLNGLSFGFYKPGTEVFTDLTQPEALKQPMNEYAFTATQASIMSADGSQNLLALGGYEEVIRIFDVKAKKDYGDLMGEHTGSITALQFYKNKFLISGAEDSKIVIWRCKDWKALHHLQIKNTSKVLSLSLHKSGKILLALYDNGVLRLWDMTTARCAFKKKLGLLEDDDFDQPVEEDEEDLIAKVDEDDKISGDGSADEFGESELEEVEKQKKDLSPYERKPTQVQWEKSKGRYYAVLYSKMLEVFDTEAEDGKAVSHCLFDIETTSFDFISEDVILVSDVNGNFTLAKGVTKQSSLRISIVKTKFPRIRQVKSSYSGLPGKQHYQYMVSISTDMKIAFWSIKKLMSLEAGDLLEEVKADKVIKSKNRLTCLAINNLNEMKSKKKKKQQVEEEEVNPEEKLVGKKREREDVQQESEEDSDGDEESGEGEEEDSSAVSDISLSSDGDEEGEIEFSDDEEGEIEFDEDDASEDSSSAPNKSKSKLDALSAKEKALQKQLGALEKEFGGLKKKQRKK